MSTEKIIRSWKNGQASPRLASNDKPETDPEKAPANPAGEQELSDEELALIEGGDGTSYQNTCNDCPPPRSA